MKKLLTVLVLAAAFTSCGGSGDSSVKTDSVVTTTVDSAATIIDSTTSKVDSTVKAVADSAKAKIGTVADSAKKVKK